MSQAKTANHETPKENAAEPTARDLGLLTLASVLEDETLLVLGAWLVLGAACLTLAACLGASCEHAARARAEARAATLSPVTACGSDLDCCTLHNDCDRDVFEPRAFVVCSVSNEFDCETLD